MTILGDLERAFASFVFPNLLPLSIVALLVLVGLVALARRRGWDRIVWRHPRAFGAIVVVFLAVAIPTGAYLVSPLFTRTELAEAAPVAASPGAAPTASSPASVKAPRSGQFVGSDSFHTGSGTVSILEPSPGAFILRFEGFEVRNGPDLYVYVSRDPGGYADGAVEVAKLRATTGSFNEPLPATLDVSTIRSVVIWCKAFGVQFAHAELPAA